MLKHTGTKIIETQRLILRQFKEEDTTDMFNNWASDDEVTKYVSWQTHSDIEVSKKILKMWIDEYSSQENYNWAIEIKENGSVVGSIALMNIDNNIENCEIGYCISKAFWNKGITTEAFSAVINFAFKEVGFERITGRHNVDNVASGRVMEKCCLRYEGTLRKIHRINTGSLVDCKYYSILKEEYVSKGISESEAVKNAIESFDKENKLKRKIANSFLNYRNNTTVFTGIVLLMLALYLGILIPVPGVDPREISRVLILSMSSLSSILLFIPLGYFIPIIFLKVKKARLVLVVTLPLGAFWGIYLSSIAIHLSIITIDLQHFSFIISIFLASLFGSMVGSMLGYGILIIISRVSLIFTNSIRKMR